MSDYQDIFDKWMDKFGDPAELLDLMGENSTHDFAYSVIEMVNNQTLKHSREAAAKHIGEEVIKSVIAHQEYFANKMAAL